MLVGSPVPDPRIPGASDRLHGSFVGLCAVLLVVGGAWAGWAPVEDVVRAPGVVRPTVSVSMVKNVVAGAVKSKDCEPGTRVRPGQILWSIDSTALTLEAANTTRQLQRLRRQWTDLRAVLDALATGAREVPPGLEEAGLRVATFFAHLENLELVARSKKDRWLRELALPSSVVLPQTLIDLEDAWRLAELETARFRAHEVDTTTAERIQILTSIEALENRLATLRTSIADAVVRSPLGGVVQEGRRFNPGDYLLAGEDVLRVVPVDGDGVRLELRVDPRDIARLAVGQVVRALFPGLPPSRFGAATGTITALAPDATLVGGTVASFVVEVTLDQTWVPARAGGRVDLKNGMVVDARIIVGTRALLSFLWETLEVLP